MAQVSVVYIGEREAMIAEVGAWDPHAIGIANRECKYLIMPYGDAQCDTSWASSIKEAKALAAEIAVAYGVKVVRVD